MAQFILNRFNKPPTNGQWKVSHFSTLKSPASAYCGFYVPMSGNGPEFNIFLFPRKHHRQDCGRLVIEYTEAYKDRTNIPNEFRDKCAHFRLSFINGRGERCKSTEATMPLYPNPDRLHEHDVHVDISYDYLLDPSNDLLQDSTTLTILVEGKLVPVASAGGKQWLCDRTDYYDAELTWTLRNVSALRLIASSPAFCVPSRPGLDLRLNFHPPMFYSTLHPNTVCIDLASCSPEDPNQPPEVNVRFRVAIVDERGQKLFSHDGQARFSYNELECSCPLLLSPKYLAKFIRNDKLILNAQIKII